MRSIILVQIVSSLLIGAASATPTNAYSTGELDLRSSELTEACSDHDFHLDDKYCTGDDCVADKLRLAKRCHPCERKKGSKTTICATYETTSYGGKKCKSGKSCEVHKDECHGKKCDEKKMKDECHGKKCDEKKRKFECHGKKCDEKKMKVECHGKDKCDHDSKETSRGYRCSGQLYNKSKVEKQAKKGCDLLSKNKKKNGYPMPYQPSDDEKSSSVPGRFRSTSGYYVYPLGDNENHKFGPRESSMVLFNNKCNVAGAVVRKEEGPCITATWCFAKLYKQSNVNYNTCDQEHR